MRDIIGKIDSIAARAESGELTLADLRMIEGLASRMRWGEGTRAREVLARLGIEPRNGQLDASRTMANLAIFEMSSSDSPAPDHVRVCFASGARLGSGQHNLAGEIWLPKSGLTASRYLLGGRSGSSDFEIEDGVLEHPGSEPIRYRIAALPVASIGQVGADPATQCFETGALVESSRQAVVLRIDIPGEAAQTPEHASRHLLLHLGRELLAGRLEAPSEISAMGLFSCTGATRMEVTILKFDSVEEPPKLAQLDRLELAAEICIPMYNPVTRVAKEDSVAEVPHNFISSFGRCARELSSSGLAIPLESYSLILTADDTQKVTATGLGSLICYDWGE